MSSVECFRQFFNERLTAAAEEIFREFEKTIVEYEEEISRQRRLLDIALKPDTQSHKTELPQQHVCKKEEEDHQLGNQESVSLDPGPPQIKEEEEELCTSYDTEKFVLKQETDNIMLTFAYEEGDHSENQTVCVKTVPASEVPEANTDQQILHHTSENKDCVSLRNKKTKPQRTRRSSTAQRKSKSVISSTTSKSPSNSQTGKNSLKCDTCGRILKDKYKLMRHHRIHTGQRPFPCNVCNKTFRDASDLRRHLKIHTGVKPYCCNLCGKRFKEKSHLREHSRIHTGEKPYSCKLCGKEFRYCGDFSAHVKTHPKATLV